MTVASPVSSTVVSVATRITSRTPAPAGANTTRNPAVQANANPPMASRAARPGDAPSRTASSQTCAHSSTQEISAQASATSTARPVSG